MSLLNSNIVREEIRYGIEEGLIPENEEALWNSYAWDINEEDIICFIQTVKHLNMSQLWTEKSNFYISYTEGDLEDQVEEIGFDGGYIIENLDTSEEYFIGWFSGEITRARELVIVPHLWFKK